ncbi:esterase-like activity of phytase family protein [Kamptonema sp. UHCC 0994]|uniref:esterase-like activity of phytase family protein n=1 Tax=Kamptonema sp. UHCC 0994 TaxID=3031329 RepID=UPI0023BAE65A|nr:esterase-like activity of phytase family protein [Kamptonema sp. UHCC 0994]MDF0556792.1 esterase-like activity of phytase family protein [Kamptonema sp. UHCC 0994]
MLQTNKNKLGNPINKLTHLVSQRILRLFTLAIILLTFATACSPPQGVAKDRIFLPLSIDFLSEYQLPKIDFDSVPVGGLSGIAYDGKGTATPNDPAFRFYAISDDPSEYGDARFYTLKLNLAAADSVKNNINKVTVEGVTYLVGEDGKTFSKDSINPEGIAISPRKSVFVASEGVTHIGIPPFVREFDLKTGKMRGSLPIPERYIPDTTDEKQARGVVDNLGFESLTIDPESLSFDGLDPFRIFTAIEAPLVQDSDPEQAKNLRLLHYVIVDKTAQLVSENFYQLDPAPLTILNGLTELVAVGKGGHFLSLERSFGLSGYGAKIFQLALGGATDTSRIYSLKGNVTTAEPIKKKLLLDLKDLGIPLYNLEGMTLGPRLSDGSQSLVLVSDDNFDEEQKTQFILFRLKYIARG